MVLRWIRTGSGARDGTEAVGQSRSWDRSRDRRTKQGFVGRIRVLRDEKGPCRTKQGPSSGTFLFSFFVVVFFKRIWASPKNSGSNPRSF